MSRRWCGKTLTGACALMAAAIVALAGCTEKFPGYPKETMQEYIDAVQRNDFDTIYRLNINTARQEQYLGLSKVGDWQLVLKENYEQNQANYEAASHSFSGGVIWSERWFFPASAKITLDEPHHPKPAGDDPLNVEYEKGFVVTVPVFVDYTKKNDAPEYSGAAIRSARFDCSLRKLREKGAVKIYSHDVTWYFAGCIVEPASIHSF